MDQYVYSTVGLFLCQWVTVLELELYLLSKSKESPRYTNYGIYTEYGNLDLISILIGTDPKSKIILHQIQDFSFALNPRFWFLFLLVSRMFTTTTSHNFFT